MMTPFSANLRRCLRRLFLSVLLGVVLLAPKAIAEDILVTTDADSGTGSLREALTAAVLERDFDAQIARMNNMFDADVPRSIAGLERMLRALERYAGTNLSDGIGSRLASPGGDSAASDSGAKRDSESPGKTSDA